MNQFYIAKKLPPAITIHIDSVGSVVVNCGRGTWPALFNRCNTTRSAIRLIRSTLKGIIATKRSKFGKYMWLEPSQHNMAEIQKRIGHRYKISTEPFVS